ncbi:hypothetical protein FB451DRAFT_1257030 [Mycena latifolia]|nr:hypothetical protein FB451DRAFT_1257030 [Mycena latifolia]
MSTPPRKSVGRSKQTPTRFTSRKKSCQNCSDAKTRCSLQRPNCSRCQVRGLACQYLTMDSPSSAPTTTPANIRDGPSADLAQNPVYPHLATSIESPPTSQSVPTSESVRIGSRWLDALIPPPGHTPKNLSSGAVRYMSRVLKTYPKIMLKAHEPLPPIIHPHQPNVAQPPLANCRSLLRMWEAKATGSESMVRHTVRREMGKLFEEHRTYDHATLLCAAQAYLLYSIHLFFSIDAESVAIVDTTTMINLQELASAVSVTGLCASEEFNRTRPAWEAWIMMEAKRRTLYAMYMFDNVFNFSQHTASYIATELGHLPNPSSRSLWAAATKDEWEIEYGRYLAEWTTNIPRLEDLWAHQTEQIAKERRARIDRWVESVDEFGMFLFAVTSLTHGS